MNKIGWCDTTVNPVVGCPNGCEYCYAKKMNDRFKWIEDFTKPKFYPERLKQFNTKKPQIIFIDSMSDIGSWGIIWHNEVVRVADNTPCNVYLALTKNLVGLGNNLDKINIRHNITYGATITKNSDLVAMNESDFGYSATDNALYNANCAINFISFEPLLEQIDIKLSLFMPEDDGTVLFGGVWWIIGAETGNRKGKVIPKKEWITEMTEFAHRYHIAVFHKDSIKELMGDDFVQEFPKFITDKVGER